MKKIVIKNAFVILCYSIFAFSFKNKIVNDNNPAVINAAMPSLAKDTKGKVYIAFASGNKLEYVESSNDGVTFSKPVLVDTIKDLYGIAGRGPKIISTSQTLTILAPDKIGNIHVYTRGEKGTWKKNGFVNDVADVCKEGFVSVSAKGDSLFADWLDARNTNRNKIVGALSINGGKTWSKNKIIYQSPDGVVCECCSPSAAFGSNCINVMFRNNWNGNRNLYLIQSYDGGNTFGEAKKIGNGNWKLDGCPMDGGGLVADNNGFVQTVWRRVDTIYSCVPGHPETMIGKGKNCTISKIGNTNVYVWIEENKIVCLLPNNKKINVGEGSYPVLQALSNTQFLCVWQNDNNVYSKIVDL